MLLLVLSFTAAQLGADLRTTWPELSPSKAEEHAQAAIDAAGDDLDPRWLLAIAAHESGFNPRSISRMEHGKRVTGVWRGKGPAGAGSRFCGVLQSQAGGSWKRCLAQQDIVVGYRVGADEIRTWLAHKKVRGSLDRALQCHGCGNSGLRGACKGYVSAVYARLGALREGRPFRPRPPSHRIRAPLPGS